MDKKIIMAAISVFSLGFAFQAEASACGIVSGKTYYSDGVSNFSDAACRQEMIGTDSSAESADIVSSVASSGSCRYNSSRMQYSDGVAFFTDSKCLKEALAGETVEQSAVTASVAAVPLMSSAQFAQITQRIDAVEKRLAVLQSIIGQILALLAKK